MSVERLIPGYPRSILAVDDDPVLRAFADAELSELTNRPMSPASAATQSAATP